MFFLVRPMLGWRCTSGARWVPRRLEARTRCTSEEDQGVVLLHPQKYSEVNPKNEMWFINNHVYYDCILLLASCKIKSEFWDQPMHFFHDISPGVEYHVLTCGSTFVNPPVGTPFAFARPTMSSFLSFARFSKVFCLGSSQPAACSRATRTPSLNLQQTGLNEGANKKVWWLVWGQIVQKSFYYVLSLSAIANKQPFHCTS